MTGCVVPLSNEDAIKFFNLSEKQDKIRANFLIFLHFKGSQKSEAGTQIKIWKKKQLEFEFFIVLKIKDHL